MEVLAFWKTYFAIGIGAVPIQIGCLLAFGNSVESTLLSMTLMSPFWAYLLAALVRRLHDRNKGAVWLLPFLGIPLALTLTAQVFEHQPALFNLSFAGAAPLTWWAMVELFVLRGARGPNRFGPDPRPANQPHPAYSVGPTPDAPPKSDLDAELQVARREIDAAIARNAH
jgi:uncharacterized membrane protein YhaH (DUF805 family)